MTILKGLKYKYCLTFWTYTKYIIQLTLLYCNTKYTATMNTVHISDLNQNKMFNLQIRLEQFTEKSLKSCR